MQNISETNALSLLEYETDEIDTAIRESPKLFDYLLTIAKKKYRDQLIRKYGKEYVISVGSYENTLISDMDKNVLKRLLTVESFKRYYPSIFYSAKLYLQT